MEPRLYVILMPSYGDLVSSYRIYAMSAVFAAIMWDKLCEMFAIVKSLS